MRNAAASSRIFYGWWMVLVSSIAMAVGTIFGWLYGAFAFGAVLGPLLMGTMFDNTGSYQLALTIFIPATVIGAGLMLPLGGRGWGLGVRGWGLAAR